MANQIEESNIETMAKYNDLKQQYLFLTEKCDIVEDELQKRIEKEKNKEISQ